MVYRIDVGKSYTFSGFLSDSFDMNLLKNRIEVYWGNGNNSSWKQIDNIEDNRICKAD